MKSLEITLAQVVKLSQVYFDLNNSGFVYEKLTKYPHVVLDSVSNTLIGIFENKAAANTAANKKYGVDNARRNCKILFARSILAGTDFPVRITNIHEFEKLSSADKKLIASVLFLVIPNHPQTSSNRYCEDLHLYDGAYPQVVSEAIIAGL